MPKLRCEKTELFVRECAHCRAGTSHPKPRPQPSRAYKSEYSREFPASFDSDCGGCGGDIEEGDMIRMGPDGATCVDCYDVA